MSLIQSLQKKKKRQADSLVEFFMFSRSTLNDCVEIYANVLRRCLHVSVCETSRTIRKIIREYFLNSIEFKKRTSFGKFRTRCSLSLSLSVALRSRKWFLDRFHATDTCNHFFARIFFISCERYKSVISLDQDKVAY